MADIEAERNRIREILACPSARMNPEQADHLAYKSNVTASVAIGVLAFASSSNVAKTGGTLPTYPAAREIILAARLRRSPG